jgi:predicted Fe-Mo cluster-binding NifX family protein
MKIAITATEPELEAVVDPRFGRCPYFLIVDTDNLHCRPVDNANQELAQGAGIQSARLVADNGVQCVLTGSCGPNAQQALSAGGVDVITGCSGTVRKVIEQFKSGQLRPPPAPATPGPGSTDLPRGGSSAGPGAGGTGPGGGMGRGRGGGGRGMGRGRGRGG